MKMKKIAVLAFFSMSITGTVLFGADVMTMKIPQIADFNCFGGSPIHTKNIEEITPKMPPEFQKKVDNWFAQEEVRSLISQLSDTPKPFDADTFRISREKKEEIMAQGEKNKLWHALSRYNSVVHARIAQSPEEEPKDAEFLVKTAGLGPRMTVLLKKMNIDVADLPPGEDGIIHLKDHDIDYSKMDPKHETQVNMTRIAHYLRVKEIIEKNGLEDYFALPAMYLYHIPGKPKDISDHNWVAIAEYVPGIEILEGPKKELTPEEEEVLKESKKQLKEKIVKKLTPEIIDKLYLVVREAGMWDTQLKNFTLNEDGKIVIFDYEGHYHNTNFFYQGDDGYRNYIKAVVKGIEHVHNKIFEAGEQRDYVKHLFEKDEILRRACKAFDYWPELEDIEK